MRWKLNSKKKKRKETARNSSNRCFVWSDWLLVPLDGWELLLICNQILNMHTVCRIFIIRFYSSFQSKSIIVNNRFSTESETTLHSKKHLLKPYNSKAARPRLGLSRGHSPLLPHGYTKYLKRVLLCLPQVPWQFQILIRFPSVKQGLILE